MAPRCRNSGSRHPTRFTTSGSRAASTGRSRRGVVCRPAHALLGAVQVAEFVLTNHASYSAARGKIEDELGVGQKVFARVLRQNDAGNMRNVSRNWPHARWFESQAADVRDFAQFSRALCKMRIATGW